MKKKTRSRSRSSSFLFVYSLVFCSIGAIVSSHLFFSNFTRSLFRNEEPVATITFKYRTAQRKFLDRTVWDRLRQQSPVYNGDTIHTSALSEATIWFTDGNVMELSENTMAQVFVQEDKTLKADLMDGTAFLDSSSSENGIIVASKGVEVELKSGSSLSAKTTADSGVSLQVVSGQAVVGTETIGEGNSLAVGEAGELVPTVSVAIPRPNEKILYHHDEMEKVAFSWSAQNFDSQSELFLEFSAGRNFAEISKKISVSDISFIRVELPEGVHYWRLSGSDRTFDSGKISLIHSPSPKLVTPVEGYTYSYRTRTPAVRLIWSESPYASTYRVLIADNPSFSNPAIDQRSSSTSSIISSLGEGKWYWQVTPYYTINQAGFEAPSETGSFVIDRKGVLESPRLYAPLNNGMVNSDVNTKAVSFSWKQDPEAVSYSIRISKNSDLSSPEIEEQVKDNYFKIGGGFRKMLGDGTWYWAVEQKDSEGNTSALSEIRRIYIVRGNIEQHLVEPVSGYGVASSLIKDMKFTWKKNIPETFRTEFQVATDRNFRNIIRSIETSATSMDGPDLLPGEYFWRIRSSDASGDVVLESPERVIRVLSNLPRPELVMPMDTAFARETLPYVFEWNSVADADFYKFSLYRVSDNFLVYEDTVYDNVFRLNLYGSEFTDMAMYRYEVQPKSMAVEGVRSRLSGQTASRSFLLVKVKPVKVTSPANYASYSGIDAILNPPVVKWATDAKVGSAQVIVTKTLDGKETEVLRLPSDRNLRKGEVAPRSFVLDTKDGLREGDYRIVIHATTEEGYDISNIEEKYVGHFSVSRISPLPQPSRTSATPPVFDVDYLRIPSNPRTVTLGWDRVEDATDYSLKIIRLNPTPKVKEKIIVDEPHLEDNFYVLNILEMDENDRRDFLKGEYKWTVEALRRVDADRDGKLDKVLQHGEVRTDYFETDILSPPRVKAVKPKNSFTLEK